MLIANKFTPVTLLSIETPATSQIFRQVESSTYAAGGLAELGIIIWALGSDSGVVIALRAHGKYSRDNKRIVEHNQLPLSCQKNA